MAKKRQLTRDEQRSIHMQRIIFIAISLIIVLSMVLMLVHVN